VAVLAIVAVVAWAVSMIDNIPEANGLAVMIGAAGVFLFIIWLVSSIVAKVISIVTADVKADYLDG
jgi:hypothetical protein